VHCIKTDFAKIAKLSEAGKDEAALNLSTKVTDECVSDLNL